MCGAYSTTLREAALCLRCFVLSGVFGFFVPSFMLLLLEKGSIARVWDYRCLLDLATDPFPAAFRLVDRASSCASGVKNNFGECWGEVCAT